MVTLFFSVVWHGLFLRLRLVRAENRVLHDDVHFDSCVVTASALSTRAMSFRLKSLPAADAHQLAGAGIWRLVIPCGRRNKYTKTMTLKELLVGFGTRVRSIWMIGLACVRQTRTRMYPEEPVYLPPRYRGRIVLTRDPTVKSAALPVTCA